MITIVATANSISIDVSLIEPTNKKDGATIILPSQGN